MDGACAEVARANLTVALASLPGWVCHPPACAMGFAEVARGADLDELPTALHAGAQCVGAVRADVDVAGVLAAHAHPSALTTASDPSVQWSCMPCGRSPAGAPSARPDGRFGAPSPGWRRCANGAPAGRAGQPVNCGATATRAQRRTVAVSVRGAAPLRNVTCARTLWRVGPLRRSGTSARTKRAPRRTFTVRTWRPWTEKRSVRPRR